MKFYGQPLLATHYVVKFVLLVCLFLALTFVLLEKYRFSLISFKYCCLMLNVNLKTPKVAPWHWLGVH